MLFMPARFMLFAPLAPLAFRFNVNGVFALDRVSGVGYG
jgi:hypothetical protein